MTRPAITPTVIGCSSDAPRPDHPPTVTPAAKKANTGTAKPADTGRIACSKSSAVGFPCRPITGHREAQQDAGNRGVHPAGVHQCPGSHRQRDQQPPMVHAALDGQPEQPDRYQRQRQRAQRQVIGVEDRDDGDGEQVVDDCQGQQEGAQRCSADGWTAPRAPQARTRCRLRSAPPSRRGSRDDPRPN